MVFWVAILAGAAFAWLAVRLKFYGTWVLFFNVLVSVYLSIFLAPMVADFAPLAGGAASYGTALSMVVLAGGCFALLHGLSYVFLTGQFTIPFPRIFDILVSGALGFVAGFLVLSFAAIVLTTTPLARNETVNSIGFNAQSQQANIRCVARCCDLIHGVAGLGDETTTESAISHLIDISRTVGERKPDVNEPPVTPARSPPRKPATRRKIADPVGDTP